ncbi:MAG: TIM barrel protein [Acidobacteria bacterium]|nr:TIM barrel protein [Acidobacteriota bacterium]
MTPQSPTADPAKLARIAIMTLNFENMLRVPGQWEEPTDTLALFDIPQMYADRYGVHNIEIQHTHFQSVEDAYVRELRARAEKVQSRFSNINLEFGPMTISSPNPVLRAQAIDLTKQWIDRAALLGSPRVMINQGAPTQENKNDGIAALKAMVEYGKSKGVMIGVETRGNASGNNRGVVNPAAQAGRAGGAGPQGGAAQTPSPSPAAPPAPGAPLPVLTTVPNWVLLAELLRDSGARANVDLGGVGAADQGELHAALRTLLPITVGSMHVRPSPRWDLATAIRFTVTLGYQGLYSIEVRGHEGTKAALDTVVANL